MAGKKISELQRRDKLDGSEQFPVAVSKSNARVSIAALKDYIPAVDPEKYLSKEEAKTGYVAQEEGKGLSSNDFTDEDKKKLNSLSNYDDTALKESISETFQPKGNYVTEEALEEKGYLTEHQDISGKQDKQDNALNTSDKTIIGAINELKSAVDVNTAAIGNMDSALKIIINDATL